MDIEPTLNGSTTMLNAMDVNAARRCPLRPIACAWLTGGTVSAKVTMASADVEPGVRRCWLMTPERIANGTYHRRLSGYSPGSNEKMDLSTLPPSVFAIERRTPSRVNPARSSTRSDSRLPTLT
jgi:hypothetical protein